MKSSFKYIIDDQEYPVIRNGVTDSKTNKHKESDTPKFNLTKGDTLNDSVALEYACPSTAINRATCEIIPNAIWIGSTHDTGTCHCCLTNGQVFASPTTPNQPCVLCSSSEDDGCGTPSPFCGATNIPNCHQNVDTLEWSIVCEGDSPTCQGFCPGSCGWGELLSFQMCKPIPGTDPLQYECQTDYTQIYTWVTYAVLYLLFVLIFMLVYKYVTKPPPSNLPTIKYVYQYPPEVHSALIPPPLVNPTYYAHPYSNVTINTATVMPIPNKCKTCKKIC